MDRQAFKQRMQNLKSYREQNPGKGYWDFKQQQAPGPYSAGELVKSIEEFTNHEEYLGPPSHNYDFTLSEEWADKHGYYPDERGHRDDRVKKEAHPTHPSKGEWKSQYQFDLTDKGIEDPNFILYGLNDGGQDPQATMTYRGGIVLPELTVTPKGNYIYNSYDNIKAYWPGGETGESEKERFYQATGRSSSGRPLEEGLKPVFSLEDAANMTPIGDAISARDTYNAVKNRDWLGAGLAALTVLPFVPSGLRNVKAAARYIPTVNRTEQSLINQALGNISKKRDYLSDIANSRNRVLEDINTIPYRNRAEQADKIFGTNYSETYDLLDDLYQHRYFDLPEVQPKDMVASGRLQAKPFAEERFNKTGVGAEPNEFDLWVNTGMYRDPMQLANHEMNHYTDYIISRNIDTSVNNNMLKQLENSLKQTDATDYYRKGTEQKAYMNQLRTILKQNGEIQNLDEPVSSALLKKYLDKMPDSDPIKKMSKQHKNIKTYTKWFNTIPLLGTATLGINTYFNNKENKQ